MKAASEDPILCVAQNRVGRRGEAERNPLSHVFFGDSVIPAGSAALELEGLGEHSSVRVRLAAAWVNCVLALGDNGNAILGDRAQVAGTQIEAQLLRVPKQEKQLDAKGKLN
jgi:hypothetical protein